MSSEESASADCTDNGDETRAHLDGLQDGCGCTEIWEYLSEQRDRSVDE